MSVVVRRVLGGWPNWAHEMSIVADGSSVTYVVAPGERLDPAFNAERPKKFVSLFEEIHGKKPETSEDYAEMASYNIGSFTIVEEPLKQTYDSTEDAVNGEEDAIEADQQRRTEEMERGTRYADEALPITEADTLEVATSDDSGEVVALVLGKTYGNSAQPFWRVDGEWSDTDPEMLDDDEMEDLSYHAVSPDYISIYDGGSRDAAGFEEFRVEAKAVTAAAACPMPTQDVELNLANRQKAIDGAGYGPMNPKRPNEAFWQAKADRWSTTIEEAKSSKCGNCAAFIITPSMRECINQGLGDNSDSWDVVEAGDLGYCEAFDFKCAAERTCDAWIVGGPVTEEK